MIIFKKISKHVFGCDAFEVSTAALTELRHGGAGETRCTSTGVTMPGVI